MHIKLSKHELNLHSPLALPRQLFSYGMAAIAFVLTALALLPLFAVLLTIVQRGLPLLKLETLTTLPAPVGVEGVANGFANAIIGTGLMVGIASLISIPLGVTTAIFLAEFGQQTAVARFVRFVASILSGVPSIVVGVFAYGVIVLATHKFSAWAGSFALMVIMLPIVILSSEAALKLVPTSQRLASAALGGNRFQTTFRVVLRAALPGILTGILLAIARAAGETAPLILTALSSDFWISSLSSPSASLAVLIYNYAFSPDLTQNQLAWTAAFVLLSFVLLLNILSRLLIRSLRRL